MSVAIELPVEGGADEHRFAREEPAAARDGVALVELTAPPRRVDLGSAPVCRLLITLRGVPVAWPEVANPGPGGAASLAELLVGPVRTEVLAWDAAAEGLRRRMGVAPQTDPAPAVSIVVCTHRRPAALRRLLGALAELDPAPAEVIVVDNDPGSDDCRAAVTAAGFRYLREGARGLDRARATGLRAARGEVVAYTDDDCVPPPGWLARLPRHFADAGVAAVTGPAFAWTLGAPAQARFEREDGFRRGLRERVHTWASLPPTRASAAGAGANMAFRRAALAALSDPFPAALDAGTPTQSGGDMWALAELLATGGRVVYDPGVWVWHEHRPEPAALHRTLWGYGVGYGSALIALAGRRGEGGAARAALWLAGQYARASAARATGRGDAVRQRAASDYLRGGLAAPRRYRASLQQAPARDAAIGAAAAVDAAPRPAADPAGAAAVPGAPAVSVVVPTFRRPRALGRLLDSLAAQAGAPPFEVVVVDDALDGADEARARELRDRFPLPLRVVPGGGGGAARARNRGAAAACAPLLLFLDDDLVPGPELLRAHAAAHDEPAIVVGSCPPRPARSTFAAECAGWWWSDQLCVRRRLSQPGFKEVLSGNTSMPAETFRALGGFDERFAAFRREDWELGLRAAAAGIPVRLADAAEAAHEFELDAARHVANGYAEGRGDALLAATHPHAAAALPLGGGYARLPRRRPLDAVALLVLGGERARGAATAVLDRLERRRDRAAWARLAALARQAAYRAGVRAAGHPPAGRGGADLVVDLHGSDPIVAPPALGRIDVRAGDRRVTLRRPEARCDEALANDIAGSVPWAMLAAAAPAPVAPADASVPVLSHDALGGWRAVDRAIRASDARRVVVTLPGVRAGADWVRRIARALDGDRVALVHGTGTRPDDPPQALDLYERRMLPDRLLPRGLPPQAVALDRDAYLAAGGFDPALDRHGPLAGLLDLAERLLDAGRVVGSFAAPGLDPPGTTRWHGRRREWQRHRALGILVCRHGGATWVARRTVLRLAVDLAAAVRPGNRRRLLRTAAEAHGWATAILR